MHPFRLSMFFFLFLFSGSDIVRAADPFEAFVVGLRSACTRPPSTKCVGAVTAFLDRDASGRIELGELEQARRMASSSIGKTASALNATERNTIAVALMILNHAGLAPVFANFDTNSDGGLDRHELFADFRLGRRSFSSIVNDPTSVNWKSFAQRFGKVGFLITDLIPPALPR